MENTSWTDKKRELEARLQGLLTRPAQAEYRPDYDPKGFPGLQALYLQGEPYRGRTTRAFGYVGFPDRPAEGRVSAVVLVHGGGGFAFPEWVKVWNERGYAALALCNTGYRPVDGEITAFADPACWQRQEDDPQGGSGPDNDAMSHAEEPLEEQWIYHGVSLTLLAHNLLRQDSRIDPDRIGITGISWGSVIASLAIGYDPRFAFAVQVYGSGFLDEGLGWIAPLFRPEPVRALWRAEERLVQVRTPVLWLCWANDPAFSIGPNSKSFDTAPHSELSIQLGISHGHPEGWGLPEIYRFADAAVRQGPPLIRLKEQPPAQLPLAWRREEAISLPLDIPPDAQQVSARLVYLTRPMAYTAQGVIEWEGCDTIDEAWKTVECRVERERVWLQIPPEADSYYIELTAVCDGKPYISASRYTAVCRRKSP